MEVRQGKALEGGTSYSVPAFSSTGQIDRDFWLTHSLDSTEIQMFRFRRSDLERLVVPAAEKRIAELQFPGEPVLAVFPHHRAPSPTSDLMTACEVLTWIAFGKPLTQYCLGADGAAMLRTWGTDQLGDLRIALEARAAEQPYTPLAGASRKPWFADSYVGQSWAKTARTIRAGARQREQRLVSFVDLRDELVREHDRSVHGDKLLEMASAQLRGSLAAGRLTAFGRRHEGSEHEPIKTTVFMDAASASTGGIRSNRRRAGGGSMKCSSRRQRCCPFGQPWQTSICLSRQARNGDLERQPARQTRAFVGSA